MATVGLSLGCEFLARAALERASAYTVARAEVDAEAARRDQVRAAARRQLAHGADLVKVMATGALLSSERCRRAVHLAPEQLAEVRRLVEPQLFGDG